MRENFGGKKGVLSFFAEYISTDEALDKELEICVQCAPSARVLWYGQ